MSNTKQTVIDILARIKDQPNLYNEEYYDKHLTGSSFNFSGRDLAYVAMELIKTFNISLAVEDVETDRFNSINGIIRCVESKKNLK